MLTTASSLRFPFIQQETRRTSRLRLLAKSFVLVALLTVTASAQNIQHTENKPDLSLRSEARIDPSTLGMSIKIPLASYPGRAGSSFPMVLFYNSKVWRIEYDDYVNGGFEYYTTTAARYAEKSVAGWTFSNPMPTLEWLGERYDTDGRPLAHPTLGVYIPRLTVRFADGSTHEMRRSDLVTSGADPITGTYYSVDSTRLKFSGTSPGAGTLYMPDGSTFLFSNWAATQHVDRNGNTTTAQMDSLGRQLVTPSFHGSDQVETHSLPGFGGSSQNVSFDLRRLDTPGVLEPDMLTGVVPSIHRVGDRDKFGNNIYTNSLFTSSADSRVIEPGLFMPVVLYRITLPNGTSYTFTYNQYGEIAKVVYPTGAYERYRYGIVPTLSTIYDPYSQANRGVLERRISADGTGNDEVIWHYEGGIVTTIAPNGTRTVRYLHAGYDFGTVVFGFEDPRAGMTYDERVHAPAAQGGGMLRRTLTKWETTGPIAGGQSSAKRDPRVKKQVEILLDTGGDALRSTTTYQYDADLNVTSTSKYDFVPISQTTAQNNDIDIVSPDARLDRCCASMRRPF